MSGGKRLEEKGVDENGNSLCSLGKNPGKFYLTFGSEQETSVVLSWSVEKGRERKEEVEMITL